MTPLHSLITALIRLLGLYFAMRALDNIAAPLFALMTQQSMMSEDLGVPFPNPWAIFLPMAAFYVILSAVIFVIAPKLARMMIGSGSSEETNVPLHETLVFCCGGLIASGAFIRLSDTIYNLTKSADGNNGPFTLDNAMLIHLFMTAVLFGSGILLIAKFHRISAWILARRVTANKETKPAR